jgi:hypothetical protein
MPRQFVFLDSEVFRSEGLTLQNPRLRGLKELADVGVVGVLTSDIVQRELGAHFSALARDATAAYRRATEALSRLVPELATQLAPVALKDVTIGAEKKLGGLLADLSATILPTGNLRAGPILDDYFAPRAPFETSKEKKAEFPDAFSLAALKAWRAVHKEPLAVVSKDKGLLAGAKLLAGCTGYERLAEFVGQANAARDTVALFVATKTARRSRKLKEWAKMVFEDQEFLVEDSFHGEISDIVVESVDISDEPDDYEVVTIDKRSAVVVTPIDVQFVASGTDMDPYDPYDPFGHEEDFRVKKSLPLDLEIEVKFNRTLTIFSLEKIDFQLFGPIKIRKPRGDEWFH